MKKCFLKVLLLTGVIFILGGCTCSKEMAAINTRLDALEEKSNEAMRNSASARVDASTALFIVNKK